MCLDCFLFGEKARKQTMVKVNKTASGCCGPQKQNSIWDVISRERKHDAIKCQQVVAISFHVGILRWVAQNAATGNQIYELRMVCNTIYQFYLYTQTSVLLYKQNTKLIGFVQRKTTYHVLWEEIIISLFLIFKNQNIFYFTFPFNNLLLCSIMQISSEVTKNLL